MEKVIVVSTNNNPDYYFYLPYIRKAWNKYGWKVCVMVTDDVTEKIESDYVIVVPKIEGVRQETIAQASRLYAGGFFADDVYLMISDMDLLPLSDYWHPTLDMDTITVFGHDLTWYSFIPMGYTGMSAKKWREVMQITENRVNDFKRDCDVTGLPYAADWEKWWNHDWTLLTQRLKPYMDKINFVNRGQIDIAGATLAKGRIDRYNWIETQNQPDWIDAHCENNNVQHPDKLGKFLDVYNKVYGE